MSKNRIVKSAPLPAKGAPPAGRDAARLAAMFGALSNPHRLVLFARLLSCCAPGTVCSFGSLKDARACVGDLGKDMGIAPSTLSHHIKELRVAGLIRVERKGRRVECCVEPEGARTLAGFMSSIGATK